jgi:hypothetical protein
MVRGKKARLNGTGRDAISIVNAKSIWKAFMSKKYLFKDFKEPFDRLCDLCVS